VNILDLLAPRDGGRQPPIIDAVDIGVGGRECWIYDKATTVGGYVQVKLRGRRYMVHRLFYEAFHGPIPRGLELDHECEVTNCVNPDHVTPVTKAQHGWRTRGRRRECRYGHSEWYWTGGRRRCRMCDRRHALNYYYRQKDG
jgi:hypothetical protein